MGSWSPFAFVFFTPFIYLAMVLTFAHTFVPAGHLGQKVIVVGVFLNNRWRFSTAKIYSHANKLFYTTQRVCFSVQSETASKIRFVGIIFESELVPVGKQSTKLGIIL